MMIPLDFFTQHSGMIDYSSITTNQQRAVRCWN